MEADPSTHDNGPGIQPSTFHHPALGGCGADGDLADFGGVAMDAPASLRRWLLCGLRV